MTENNWNICSVAMCLAFSAAIKETEGLPRHNSLPVFFFIIFSHSKQIINICDDTIIVDMCMERVIRILNSSHVATGTRLEKTQMMEHLETPYYPNNPSRLLYGQL